MNLFKKKVVFLLLALLPMAQGAADEKEQIAACRAALEKKGGDRSSLLLKLAIAYLRDQNEELALESFLEALAAAKGGGQAKEDTRYAEALELYLHSQNPKETAQRLIENYPCEADAASNLSLIVAAAYANLHRFEEFFPRFYAAYCTHPDHWLSHKTCAALNVRLLARQRSDEAKEKFRKNALAHTREALDRCPQDTSLHKWLINLSDEKQKGEAVSSCLRKIIDGNIVVARSDIAFFIQQAVECGELGTAQQFLDKAKEWYSFSRVIAAAQCYLDQQKGSKRD